MQTFALSNTTLEALCDSYAEFENNFALHDKALYDFIFDQNRSLMTVKKRHVATTNLKKLLTATFAISAKVGFHEMSLRDLSTETGVSMGSIYACIGKKENLAVIIKDVVSLLSSNINNHASQEPTAQRRLETTIRLHYYTTCLLRSWYSFLYMETRCLPEIAQQDSKQIELNNIDNFQKLLEDRIGVNKVNTQKNQLMATTILVLLQDWYLKPWKHSYDHQTIETHLADILEMVNTYIQSQLSDSHANV